MTLNNFDEFIDKTDYLQTRLLQVNSCGSERVVKYDYTILRSNGRRDFHFLYLQNGWLDIEVGTAKARLSRGQCAVFLPNVRQMYSFTAAGDPVSLYLHFTGQAAAEAMQYPRPTENMIYTISDQTLLKACSTGSIACTICSSPPRCRSRRKTASSCSSSPSSAAAARTMKHPSAAISSAPWNICESTCRSRSISRPLPRRCT